MWVLTDKKINHSFFPFKPVYLDIFSISNVGLFLTFILLIYLNFQSLEVVSRYHNPQPQGVEIIHICLI